ncbi:CASP-like protein 5C1 isoform X1 [Phragmites australis]|uniref:CASP-like protein 5C1 isoform X1 n=1 Tax=Phragmites australis TaxID=29695 RepID=UPI002D765DA5|nr:CASP-like protein 5C1 isoform X1 [Phragmites australis]
MENRATAGAVGSGGSLGLRVGQAVFSSASLLFISVGVDFFSYTAFCFMVTIMGLLIPWSCTLAMIDVYSILVGCHLRVPGVMVIVVVGDWVCTPGYSCHAGSVFLPSLVRSSMSVIIKEHFPRKSSRSCRYSRLQPPARAPQSSTSSSSSMETNVPQGSAGGTSCLL